MSLIEGLRNYIPGFKKEQEPPRPLEFRFQAPAEARQAADAIFQNLTDGNNDSIHAAFARFQDQNPHARSIHIIPNQETQTALTRFHDELTNDLVGTPNRRNALTEGLLFTPVARLLHRIATVDYNGSPLSSSEELIRNTSAINGVATELSKSLMQEYADAQNATAAPDNQKNTAEAEKLSEREAYAKQIASILRDGDYKIIEESIRRSYREYNANKPVAVKYERRPNFPQQIEELLNNLEARIAQVPQDQKPVVITEIQAVITGLLTANPPALQLPWRQEVTPQAIEPQDRTNALVTEIANAVAAEFKAKYEQKTGWERISGCCPVPIDGLIEGLRKLTGRKRGESNEPRTETLRKQWGSIYNRVRGGETNTQASEQLTQDQQNALIALVEWQNQPPASGTGTGTDTLALNQIINDLANRPDVTIEPNFVQNTVARTGSVLEINRNILVDSLRNGQEATAAVLTFVQNVLPADQFLRQMDAGAARSVQAEAVRSLLAQANIRSNEQVLQEFVTPTQQQSQQEKSKPKRKERKGSLSEDDRKHVAEFIENNWDELEGFMDLEPALLSLKNELLVAFGKARSAAKLKKDLKQPEDIRDAEEDIYAYHELCVRFLVYAQLLGVELPNGGSYADLLKQEVTELPESSKEQLDAYENLAQFVEKNQNHILRQAVVARNENKITRQTLKLITDSLLDITNTKKGIAAKTAIGRKESSENLLHALTKMRLAGVDIQLERPDASQPGQAYSLEDFIADYASDEYAKMVDELKAGNFTKEQEEWIVDLQHASIDRTWKGKFKNFFKNNRIEIAGFAVGAGGMWVANEFQRRGMHVDAYVIKMGVQFYGSAVLSTLGFVPAQLRVIQGKQLIARTLEKNYDPNKKYLGFIPSLPKQFAWLDSVSTHGFYRFTHALVTGVAFENLAEMYMGPHMHFSDGTEAQMADAPEPQAETVQMSSAHDIADTIAHGDFSRIEAALDGVVDVNTGEPISLEGYHALGGAIDTGDGDYQVILDKVGQVGAGEISAGDIKVAIFSEGTMRFSINTIDDAGQARWEPLETVAIPVPVATESPAPHEGAGEDADTDSTATAETDDQTYERPEEFIENFENLEPGVKEQIEVQGRQVAHYVEEGVVVTGYQQAYVVQLDSEGHALHSFKGDMLLVPTSLDGFDTDHIVPLATGSDAQHEFVIPQMGHSGEEPQTGDLVARFRGAQVEWFIYDEVNVPGADSVPASVPLKGVLHGDIPELAESYAELRDDLVEVAKDIIIHVPGTLPEGWEVGADGKIVPIEPDAGEVSAEGGEGDGNLFDQLESEATGEEVIEEMGENAANPPEVEVAAPAPAPEGATDGTGHLGEGGGADSTDTDPQGGRELGPMHPETIANLEIDTDVKFSDQNAWRAVERVLNSSESLDVQNGCIVFTPKNGEPVPTTVTYNVAVDFGEDVAAGLQARAAEKLGIPGHELALGDKVVYVDQFDSVQQMDKWLETEGRELGVQGVVVSDEGMDKLLNYGTHMNDGELPEKWHSPIQEIINERSNALDVTGPQGAAGDRGGLGKAGVLEEPVFGKDTAYMNAMLDVAQGEKPDATLQGSGLLDLVDGKPGGIPVNPENGTPIQEPLTSETIIARADANEGSATVTDATPVEAPVPGQPITPEQLDSHIAEGWGALEANHPILNGVVHEEAAQGALEHYARAVMGAGSDDEVAVKFIEFAAAGDGEYVVKLATMTNEAMNDYVADLQGTGLDPLQAEVADHAKGLSPMDRVLVRAAQGIDDNLTVTINGRERVLSPDDQHAILVRAMSNPAITELTSGASYNEARIDGAIAAADIQDPLLYAGNQDLYNQEVLGK